MMKKGFCYILKKRLKYYFKIKVKEYQLSLLRDGRLDSCITSINKK